jgi:hypothetical protein
MRIERAEAAKEKAQLEAKIESLLGGGSTDLAP